MKVMKFGGTSVGTPQRMKEQEESRWRQRGNQSSGAEVRPSRGRTLHQSRDKSHHT